MRALVILVCLASIPVSVNAQTATPLFAGIPTPAFGFSDVAGATTHFVNNASAAATDTNNPTGTLAKPRRTVPTSLAAGSVVEVRGGPYSLAASVTWTANGTAAKPVFIKGVGTPVFQGSGDGRIVIVGAYFIIDGITLKSAPLNMASSVHHFALRHSRVIEFSPGRSASAVALSGKDIVILDNEVANNGDPDAATEIDLVGVYIMPGAERVWVLSNRIHHNGGDGVLVGSENSPEPWARFAYVAGNELHEDRENGVDIKRARDVVVSQNVIYGYTATSSSSGESIISHYLPERVWILDNLVASSEQGIVSTGANGYFVAGNLIVGIRHRPSTAYDPNSLWGASGILTYNTASSAHVNNTIYASDSGINIPSGGPSDVVNNIVSAPSQPSGAIRFGSTALRTNSIVSNNLTTGDPGFVNPAGFDFRLRAGSPAIDAGVADWIYTEFQGYYGVSLSRTLYGTARLLGATYDIGAAEYVR